MPPKTKHSLEEIVDAAFSLVRRDGIEKLSARRIAGHLGCSTMPIYSCGRSMAEIKAEVIKRAWRLLARFQRKNRSNDPYVDLGIGYVMFAKEETHLFNTIHNHGFRELNAIHAEENFLENMEILRDYPLLKGVPDAVKMKIIIQSWIYTHGFATLMNNPLGRSMDGLESEQEIIDHFLDATTMYRTGFETIIKQGLHGCEPGSPAKDSGCPGEKKGGGNTLESH